jgi:hypothetical protein
MVLAAKQIPAVRRFINGVQRVQTVTLAASGPLTLDLANGAVGVFDVTVATGVNITGIAFANVPSVAPVAPETLPAEMSVLLYIKRQGTLGTFAWGTSETWHPATPTFTLSNTAGRYDSFIFQSIDQGDSWFVMQGVAGAD